MYFFIPRPFQLGLFSIYKQCIENDLEFSFEEKKRISVFHFPPTHGIAFYIFFINSKEKTTFKKGIYPSSDHKFLTSNVGKKK